MGFFFTIFAHYFDMVEILKFLRVEWYILLTYLAGIFKSNNLTLFFERLPYLYYNSVIFLQLHFTDISWFTVLMVIEKWGKYTLSFWSRFPFCGDWFCGASYSFHGRLLTG